MNEYYRRWGRDPSDCRHPGAVDVEISTGEIVARWCSDCQTQITDPAWDVGRRPGTQPEPKPRLDATKAALVSQQRVLDSLPRRSATGWLNEHGEFRSATAPVAPPPPPRCDFCNEPMHTPPEERLHLSVCTPERIHP